MDDEMGACRVEGKGRESQLAMELIVESGGLKVISNMVQKALQRITSH
jgi:hypothetical protein